MQSPQTDSPPTLMRTINVFKRFQKTYLYLLSISSLHTILLANQYPLINYLTLAELRRNHAVMKTAEMAEQRANLYHEANLKLSEKLARMERLQKAKEQQAKFKKPSTSSKAEYGDRLGDYVNVGAARSLEALIDGPVKLQSAMRTINQVPYFVSSNF